MRRWLLAALAASGCGDVLGYHRLYECPANDDDCDELLDDVDPCPADRGDTADEDGDGVGDACDPNLGVPGDTITSFSGFATDDGSWQVLAGDWHVADSALSGSGITNGDARHAIELATQPTIEISATLEFAGEGSAIGGYVVTDTNQVVVQCWVVHETSGDLLEVLLFDTPVAMVAGLPGKASEGLRLYGGQLPSGAMRCRARYGDHDSLSIDYGLGLFPDPSSIIAIGVRTVQTTAQFQSAVVYAVP